MDSTQAGASPAHNAPAAALVDGARERFRVFFTELQARFVERQDVIEQIALALLSRQHVLLTGPPGTAKSALCKSVLSNVIDRATGKPSVFSKQLTESTVQTDLVGPLDFKTLMDSGRSEHFTDEGMLGAVHAFLDEVLDGRDMLLRSTLNMLHERELKQGTKTTPGQIECALMTTNRYLSEVLEQSRETLLAFIDRIAFVSFVPKGFGDPKNLTTVIERVVEGRVGGPMPLLTIQDLDVLQEIAESVQLPSYCHAALVSFLQRLEYETATATRADPSFVPTRYISTRTVVRTAELLRAICVLDWIMADTERPLRVGFRDFPKLRLTLLLSGPAGEHVPALLERETDPRERRQLSILQTERQVFDRVVSELPAEPDVPGEEPSVELPSVLGMHQLSVERQVALCDELIQHTKRPGTEGIEARALLEEATALLVRSVVGSALRAGLNEEEGERAIASLTQLATKLDKAHPAVRRLSPWVRSRALEVLEGQLELSPGGLSQTARQSIVEVWTLEQTEQRAELLIEELYRRWRTRDLLVAGGAVPTAQSEPRWHAAIAQLEATLVQLWDEGLRHFLQQGRQGASQFGESLESILEVLRGPLEMMGRSGARLARLGGRRNSISQLVVGHRLLPLLERAFTKSAPSGRLAVVQSVEALLLQLDDAGLQWAIAPEPLVGWATRALLSEVPPVSDKPAAHSYDGYRQLRETQPKVALCFALADICTRVASRSEALRAAGGSGVDSVKGLLSTLETAQLDAIVERDLARVTRAYEFIESWWQRLQATVEGTPSERLQHLLDSRIHELLDTEQVLLRFSLEAKLVGELIPAAHARSEAVHTRLVALNERIMGDIRKLWAERSTGIWRDIVSQT